MFDGIFSMDLFFDLVALRHLTLWNTPFTVMCNTGDREDAEDQSKNGTCKLRCRDYHQVGQVDDPFGLVDVDAKSDSWIEATSCHASKEKNQDK